MTDLIVSPRKHNIIQPTVRLVNPILGRKDRVAIVWVTLEGLGIYDLVGEATADDKGVL